MGGRERRRDEINVWCQNMNMVFIPYNLQSESRTTALIYYEPNQLLQTMDWDDTRVINDGGNSI